MTGPHVLVRAASGFAALIRPQPRGCNRKKPGIADATSPRRMTSDVTSLIRRDHDDFDHMLLAMTDPATPTSEALSLLDALQTGFGAHTIAQSAALREVLGPAPSPRTLAMIVQSVLDEHRSQARILAALTLAGPGTNTWRARALELRAQLIDHATREEFMRASLTDHVPIESQSALARTYATERLRRLVIVDARILGGAALSLN